METHELRRWQDYKCDQSEGSVELWIPAAALRNKRSGSDQQLHRGPNSWLPRIRCKLRLDANNSEQPADSFVVGRWLVPVDTAKGQLAGVFNDLHISGVPGGDGPADNFFDQEGEAGRQTGPL